MNLAIMLMLGLVLGAALGPILRPLQRLRALVPMNQDQLQDATHRSLDLLRQRFPDDAVIFILAASGGRASIAHCAKSSENVINGLRVVIADLEAGRYRDTEVVSES
jgi:hypothetical protein